VTGEDAFEIAAAVAAISGLAALLILCLLAVVGVWRLFRLASDANAAATRASLGTEELSRRLASTSEPATPTDQFAQLRQEAESLLDQQRKLQETARSLLEAEVLEGTEESGTITELESAVSRLDDTVGQMATSLANLIQSLQRQQEDR
jgi:hypothetical protein